MDGLLLGGYVYGVACFLAGFFETMVEYMDDASKCNNIKKWREHLVHKETSEN